jgi:hypothetical protein
MPTTALSRRPSGARPGHVRVTISQLIASWRSALAAATTALAAARECGVYTPRIAAELERRLADERRWLDRFAETTATAFP